MEKSVQDVGHNLNKSSSPCG